MILAKTTEYALSVLAYMATREEMIYSADSLHTELDIPPKYLRRILTTLVKKGFIVSTRGRRGGFTFTRDLSGIHLFEIIESMEGKGAMNSCPIGLTACLSNKPCVLHDSWTEARNTLKKALMNTSLADLREKYTKDRNPGDEYSYEGYGNDEYSKFSYLNPISRIRV